MKLKCYIPVRNLMTFTRQMVEWLTTRGVEPVILDNDSSYRPLLDWYETKPCAVIQLHENLGPYALWKSGRVPDGPFFLSDPDLDLTGVPDDFQSVMIGVLERNPGKTKVGLSLEIEDIPERNLNSLWMGWPSIKDWERRFWNPDKRTPDGFTVQVDTTFALYRAGTPFSLEVFDFFDAIRLDRPYTARHLPWYLDYEHLDAEYVYYLREAERTIGHSRTLLKEYYP